jgi:RNA recognition motif-containing protein
MIVVVKTFDDLYVIKVKFPQKLISLRVVYFGRGSNQGSCSFCVLPLTLFAHADNLTRHFKKYGEIIDAVIMKDRSTGHPRGFGFVTFADASACEHVVQDKHVINGRTVEAKISIPRENMGASKGPKTKKIFVGGIPPSIVDGMQKVLCWH